MRIVFIHRQPRPGGFSIENLFSTIADELRSRGETVIDYKLGLRREILKDIHALRKLKADIYHVTGDVNYMVVFLPWQKTVLTVHDIGNYLFGLKGWRREIYKWIWLLLPMRLAGHVTAVSEATRDLIIRYLDINSERIIVVYNCYDPVYRAKPSVFNAVCPRILQVGTASYKNVPRLIYALQGISCQLVLVGNLDTEILTALTETGVAYENRSSISQEALLEEYAKADLVAFVSIGEGFGMPIIEAQAMTKPLITANRPPMAMTAGRGACLANPLDVNSIRRGILKLIGDEAYRLEVVVRGNENLAHYSPDVIAEEYLKIYHDTVAN